jgi:metallo-beta-lactamase family protein
MADAEKSLALSESFPYETDIEIFDGIKISFLDAGHLLGSSSIYVTVNEDGKETTILFSGISETRAVH